MPLTTLATTFTFLTLATKLFPWLDPAEIINAAGPGALLVVCLIVFAETGLLVGFILPGDTLLVITGVLSFTGTMVTPPAGIIIPIWWVCLAIAVSAFIGGELGYLIGHQLGPAVFEKRESGLFSKENVVRAHNFFERFGSLAVVLARFVPVVRTFIPVAAGVAKMSYRSYCVYNAIGAGVWGGGLTFAGFLLGYIPWLKNFVVDYIDIMLLAAIVVAVLPAVYHYFRSLAKAKRKNKEAAPR